MKQSLLLILFLIFTAGLVKGQTTILDFETPGTSTTFQYFGSPLDPTLNKAVANPNATGINTSSMVAEFIKPAVAETWAGAFSNPNPSIPVNLVDNDKVTINVHMDHIGSLSLKLEGSTDGGDDWIVTVPNTKVNEWETLEFDATLPSQEGTKKPAKGYTYARITLFFDFGSGGTGTDVTSYFDDIVAVPSAPVETVILDFETPETGTTFQYFGSPLDPTLTKIVANPNATGINTSSMVTEFIKPAVAETWAGAFSNPNPAIPVNLVDNDVVTIKVHMDHIGSLSLKLEGSTDGGDDWIVTMPNTKVNEWETLEFDATLPSQEGTKKPAKGHTYARITLFFDFGTGGTGTDVTSYFDDIRVKGSGAPKVRTVNFKVDMNQYTENFDKVYLSGTFNNWSGDANPLSDDDFDGIWEGSLQLFNGTYEYKVTLDNWNAEEKFAGTEECTRTDPSGLYTNRLLAVSGDSDLPKFCFNSCYACGEERKITFKLGMGGVTPNPEGVWLAGGGNFEIPGGRFKMQDNDADGVYEIVVGRKVGFSSDYTFTNGPCVDYSCKEILEGLGCGVPPYNDRHLPPVTQDTVITTCFGTCFANTECTNGTKDLETDPLLFQLWGNPSSLGYSTLEFGRDVRGTRNVLVNDLLGQLKGQWQLGDEQNIFSLQTQDFPAGLYLVTVRVGNRTYTRKLVK